MHILCPLLLLLTLGQPALALVCSIYDYSDSTVRCVSACPQGTDRIGNNCLTPSQYLVNSQVFTCRGLVSSDHTVCCDPGHYVQDNTCKKCQGRIFNGGRSCCDGSHYLDYSSGTPNCVSLGGGACSGLTFTTPFKVCCPGGTGFNVATFQCENQNSLNCDFTVNGCCPAGQRLEYSDGYRCLATCSWANSPSSSLLCLNKHCGSYGVPVRTGPLSYHS